MVEPKAARPRLGAVQVTSRESNVPSRWEDSRMSTAPSSDIAVRHVGAVIVVDILDRRLIDAAHIEQIGEQLHDMVNAAAVPMIVLNFDKVEYLSSSALNILIALENSIRKKKGQLRLAGLDQELRKVFTLMKLTKVMVLCENVDEAMKSM